MSSVDKRAKRLRMSEGTVAEGKAVLVLLKERCYEDARAVIMAGRPFICRGDLSNCEIEVRQTYKKHMTGSLLQHAILDRAPINFVRFLIEIYKTTIPGWRAAPVHLRYICHMHMIMKTPRHHDDREDAHASDHTRFREPLDYMELLPAKSMRLGCNDDRRMFYEIMKDAFMMLTTGREGYVDSWPYAFMNLIMKLVDCKFIDRMKEYRFVISDGLPWIFTILGLVGKMLIDSHCHLRPNECWIPIFTFIVMMKNGFRMGPHQHMMVDNDAIVSPLIRSYRELFRAKIEYVDLFVALLSPRYVPRISKKVDRYYQKIPEDVIRRVYKMLV